MKLRTQAVTLVLLFTPVALLLAADKKSRAKSPVMRTIDPRALLMADDLMKGSPNEQENALSLLREGTGTVYTEALAFAIPKLGEAMRRKARKVLAERLTRMTDQTLGQYLLNEDAEIRRAAALACAMKDSKAQVPHLIPLLKDPETMVVRAAHLALKELTGQELAPTHVVWRAWWHQQKK